jgi:heme o synthase
MRISPAETPATPAEIPLEARGRKSVAAAYLELTKPRLSMLSVITALVGFLAARPAEAWWGALHVLIGTALAAGGAAVLNQWFERQTDARMHRTMDRPLPTGVVSPGAALIWGILLSIAGVGHLLFWANLPAGVLAAATILIYVLLYTPLKRSSGLSLEVGAVAGALPPLIGWAAAEGGISSLGWILFGVLFFWQVPHFLAIAWIYRDDYAAVNFPMLTVVDETGDRAATHALGHCLALLAVSLLPYWLGHTTLFYFIPALLLGLYFCWQTWLFRRARERDGPARKVFLTSITYLPLLLLFLVADRWLFS